MCFYHLPSHKFIFSLYFLLYISSTMSWSPWSLDNFIFITWRWGMKSSFQILEKYISFSIISLFSSYTYIYTQHNIYIWTHALIQRIANIYNSVNSFTPSPNPKQKSESEVTQSCQTLCNPVDCSLPGSSFHGVLQARILESVAISFSILSRINDFLNAEIKIKNCYDKIMRKKNAKRENQRKNTGRKSYLRDTAVTGPSLST